MKKTGLGSLNRFRPDGRWIVSGGRPKGASPGYPLDAPAEVQVAGLSYPGAYDQLPWAQFISIVKFRLPSKRPECHSEGSHHQKASLD